jgi:hypothetical protein
MHVDRANIADHSSVNGGSDGNGRATFNTVNFGWPAHAGYEGRHIRLGDIDGDGRTDYCVIGDDGVTKCWRNGGLGNTAAYWQDMGIVFPPKGKGDIRGTRFVDINGDGRSDWIWVGDAGETDIYTNMRGPGPDAGDMKGIVPYWLRATAFHGGMGKAGVRDNIFFARIFSKDAQGGVATCGWSRPGLLSPCTYGATMALGARSARAIGTGTATCREMERMTTFKFDQTAMWRCGVTLRILPNGAHTSHEL